MTKEVLSKLLFGLQLQATCWYHAQCMLPRANYLHHVLATVFPSHESLCIFFPAHYEDRRVSNHRLVTTNFLHCCSLFQQHWKIAFCLNNAYRFQSTWIHFLGLNEVHRLQCQIHAQQEIRGLPTNMVRKISKHHEVPSANMYRIWGGIPKHFCKWFHSFRTLCICPP